MATKKSDHLRWSLPLLLALMVFGLKAAFILWTPLRSLILSPWLIDDSFIVMRVARNVALGAGFSFDGLHPTTGVSPLWTYLTSVFHLLFTKDAAVKATLIFSSFFGMIATLLTFNIAYRITQKRSLAWLSFLFATLLPVLFFNAMNGMETAFFTVLLLLAIRSVFGIDQDQKITPLRSGMMTGLFLGLAFLTRVDTIFLIAAIAFIQAFTFLREKKYRKAILHEWVGIALTLGLCVILFGLWQMWQTGNLFPDNQIGRRTIAMMKHGYDPATSSILYYLKIVAWNDFELEKILSLSLTSSVLALLALAFAIPGRRTARLGVLTGLYFFFFAGALVAYQWYFPDFHGLRYLNPLLHLLVIFIADLFLMIPLSKFRPAVITAFFLIIVSLTWYRYMDFVRDPLWAKGMSLFGSTSEEVEEEFWSSIDWVSKNTPENSVIAIRDHGRFAYFTDRPVQDLAGILDPGVVVNWKAGTLKKYLTERRVAYAYLPVPKKGSETLYQAVHEALRLTLAKDAPLQNMTGFRLFEVQ